MSNFLLVLIATGLFVFLLLVIMTNKINLKNKDMDDNSWRNREYLNLSVNGTRLFSFDFNYNASYTEEGLKMINGWLNSKIYTKQGWDLLTFVQNIGKIVSSDLSSDEIKFKVKEMIEESGLEFDKTPEWMLVKNYP